jgi:hypothetical protein
MAAEERTPPHVPPPPRARPLEGLSGMRPRGEPGEPQEKNEVGDVERRGLGREEQRQIEAAVEAQTEEVRFPEEGEAAGGQAPLDGRTVEPHEDKGLSR